jgi:histidine ammonia-lyase
VLDGRSLTCAQVAAIARREATVVVGDTAVAAARAAWREAQDVATRQPVYGRNTGVGANHAVDIGEDERADHGLRLLRSHAAGAGPLLAPEVARAMLVVRLNQIGVGGSGVDPATMGVLAEAINQGFTPPVPLYGAIGTGDLTALAATALCLLGERAWVQGTGGSGPWSVEGAEGSGPRGAEGTGLSGPRRVESAGAPAPRWELRASEALAFISSNAATLGDAALACHDLAGLLGSAVTLAALSLFAVRGSLQPYAAAVHRARPHAGQQRVAGEVRGLLACEHLSPTRVQDPYGYRAFPQVHGPAVEALERAERAITTELNAAAENPLIDVAEHTAWHNGNFHAAYVGLALDAVRAALFQTAALSVARLGTLVEPSFTGLNAFLAETPASSGIMVLEYVAQSAVADIRRFAAPAALGSAVLSRGVEEHAGFSTQSARATSDAVAAYRAALACELVAAVRALRMQGRVPAEGGGLRRAYDRAGAVLDPDTSDRPLDGDLTAAGALLSTFAAPALAWDDPVG